MNLPSLDSLICFEAAARLLNFREAAKVVCLTPAAVGQRIRQLEDQLGAELFHRTSRTVRLTDAGRALLPAARACIAAAQGCIEAVHAGDGPPPQEVTIGATYEIGLSWLTPALGAINTVLPQVTVHLHLGPAPSLLAGVRSQEIDAAVTSYEVLDPAFDSISLKEESYVLVASPKLLGRVPFIGPEDAAGHTLLDVRPALPMFRRFAEAPDLKAPLAFAQVRFLGSTETIRRLVIDGEGVAVLPVYLVERDLAEGRLQAVLPEIQPLSSTFRLFFSKNDTRQAVYQSMAQVLAALPLVEPRRGL